MCKVIYARFGGETPGRTTREALALDACAEAYECEALEQFEAADLLYRRALKLWPGCALAHINLGVRAYKQGKTAGARHHLAEAWRLDPQSYEAAFNLGAMAYEERDLERAERFLKLASLIRPTMLEARTLLEDVAKMKKGRL